MKTSVRMRTVAAAIAAAMLFLIVCAPSIFAGETKTGTVYGIYTYLNVRSSPSTSASVVGKLYNDAKVTILGSSGNFYKITYKSGSTKITGYASKDYIMIDPASNPKPPAEDKDFEAYLTEQGFPESYKPALRLLHEQHPKWIFVAQDTGLKWSDVLKNEKVLGKNLVGISNLESWKSMEKGAYNFNTDSYVGLDGSSWVAASEKLIAYYLDPRNFLNDATILMFENLSYNKNVQTEANVKTILKNSFMKGSYTTPDTKKTYTYSSTFMAAAKASGVSPYHLASRALQEQGINGTSLSSGTVSGHKGYFNFFNIQAFASSGRTAAENGARYAATTNATFSLPWTNQYKSIVGGSVWIGTGYIDKLQDTLYLQKFDVVDGGNGLYNHQYMTNVQAAESEARIMKNAYPSELFNSALEFKIPVYTDMPEKACAKPTSDLSNNNLLDSITVGSLTLSPKFNRYTYNYEVEVPKGTASVTVKAVANHSKATVSGTGKIALEPGDNVVKITCKSPSGLTRTYKVTIVRPADDLAKGDVTGDKTININDALTIVRYVNGLSKLNAAQLKAADVTGDGDVNINDSLTIVRYVNGLIKKL